MSTSAAQQHSDHLAVLGLQRAPFLDQIDDRFFYADPQLVQRLDLLQHLIQFGDMLLGVSGPAGSGKSTLLQQFLRRGTTAWRSCHLNGGLIQQPDDLLMQLAEGFGLDRSAAPDRLKADLLRLFQTLRHASLIPVVAIDDAQLLPDPALKTLLELGGEPRETLKLLRIALFSEPGLEQRLIQAGWHSPLQPLLHNLDLPRLDDHQTAAYLMYRLAVAGYSGESPFSLTEIRALHKAADGLPGRLNVLAHETLMEHASRLAARQRGASTAKPGTPRRPLRAVGIAAGVLALGALGGYLSLRPTPEIASGPDPVMESMPEAASEQAPIAPKTVAETAATESSPPQVADAAVPLPPLPAPVTEPPAPDELGEAAIPDQAGTAAATEASPAAEAATPSPAAVQAEMLAAGSVVPAASLPAQADLPAATDAQAKVPATLPAPEEQAAPATATPAEPVPVPPTARPENVAAPEVGSTPAAVKPAAEPETSAPAAEPPQKTAPAEEVAAAPATPAPAAAAKSAPPLPLNLPAGVNQTDWLLERPARHFALQLLAVRNPASLRGYLRDHPIPDPVAVFRTRLKGSDWYVLLQGDYPDMSTARAAAADLPAAVRKSKPWARSFASVHTDIRKTLP